jgi:hypothetical protein
MKRVLSLIMAMAFSTVIFSQESQTDKALEIIKKQGLEMSQVAEIASYMTDVYGQRLTGSTNLDKATDWTVEELKKWGMQNVHLDEWGPFGRGWDLNHFEMHVTSPDYWTVLAYPNAWSSSGSGSGEVIMVAIKEEADLAKYKGKLKGKFVMIETIREVEEHFEGIARRHNAESLLDMANAGVSPPRQFRRRNSGGFNLRQETWKLFEAERPLAVMTRGRKGEQGTVFVSGARTGEGSARDKGKYVVPQVALAVEHYNRLSRMLAKGVSVTMNLDLKTTYTNPDGMEHNIIAEIPGTDLKDEVVIFGGHFDSWHAGTGATDNASGCAVMMEAARIIMELMKETGMKPRRTLRLALWTGEEQGLFGSRGYVSSHYIEKERTEDSPRVLNSAHEKVSAYYNMDNGTGKIRGVYMQGNQKALPIFREWLKPFKDMGASTLTLSNTGGTDHLAFDAIGVPGFQFIQEPIAYSTLTHHSNMDNYDHLVIEDLKQAATIIAYFIWQTAQRDELIPRK